MLLQGEEGNKNDEEARGVGNVYKRKVTQRKNKTRTQTLGVFPPFYYFEGGGAIHQVEQPRGSFEFLGPDAQYKNRPFSFTHPPLPTKRLL